MLKLHETVQKKTLMPSSLFVHQTETFFCKPTLIYVGFESFDDTTLKYSLSILLASLLQNGRSLFTSVLVSYCIQHLQCDRVKFLQREQVEYV